MRLVKRTRYDISDRSDIALEFRKIMLSRTIMIMIILIAIFTSLLVPGGRFSDLDFWARLTANLSIAGIYVIFLVFVFPVFLHLGLTRNIPFIWILIAFFIPISLVEAGFVVAFSATPAYANPVLWYWLATMFMVIFASSLATALFQDRLARALSQQPETLSFWWPNRIVENPLETLLSSEMRGPIQTIIAENQYVRVETSNGNELLRMSLTEASNMMDPRIGTRIHRSVWIRYSNITEVVSIGGNPRARAKTGTLHPISRKQTDKLKEMLSERAV